MRLVVSVLSLIAILLGSAFCYVYAELSTERAKSSTRVATDDVDRGLLGARLQRCSALTADLEPTEPSPPAAKEPPQTSVASDPDGEISPARMQVTRELSRRRQEIVLRRRYGSLGEELHLMPEDERALLSLLLDQQIRRLEMVRMHAGDRARLNDSLSELHLRHEAELMAALGDRYLPFEDYQRSLGERMEIELVSLQMEAADAPLRDDQRRELLALMVDERDSIPRPARLPGFSLQEHMAKQQEWQVRYEQRVRDRAAGVLSADQLRQYDVYRNLQSITRRRRLAT